MMPGTMDFGLFFLMQRDDAWSERAVYDSALEQMLAAESLGYHSVWIAEHHFSDYGHSPPRDGREPAAAPSSGRSRRAARHARHRDRWTARRRHRTRRHAPGLPDVPVRARRRAAADRGRHRADA